MAGSFGYEKEHYKSQCRLVNWFYFLQFVNNADTIIAAPGTSCRHQIKDGTGRIAKHPVEIFIRL